MTALPEPPPALTEPAKHLPYGFVTRYKVLLKNLSPSQADILHVAPLALQTMCELRRHLQCPLEFSQVTQEEFNHQLEHHYQTRAGKALQIAEDIEDQSSLLDMMDSLPKTEDLLESEDDAPIIRLLNALLTEAIKKNASDIHIETFTDHLVVRFRIDGILQEILQPQRVLAPLIVSRIKVMAKLDIAEKRLPQDGRIALKIAGRAVDVRVSTLPTGHGERVVMRLLDQKAARLNLSHLGMAAQTLDLVHKLMTKPHGIILVTGPTGAGKTTSLYAVLTELNQTTRNILTVEDPIEYYLPGIGQTQVNPKINLTFAKGLRAILRQDPDVVMIGEIRDLETAEIAVQSSLTGHLVLSTLHTNTAVGAITRLMDMGIEPFLLASSLLGVIAQRLVRVLCPHCKKSLSATSAECKTLGVSPESPPMIYHPVGCELCNKSGYKGRTGIYELIAIDETLRTMIHERASEQNLGMYSHRLYPTISQDGLRRVLLGETTLEEVLRVTLEEA